MQISKDGEGIITVPIEYENGQLRPGKPEPFLLHERILHIQPAFSPDGRWLAYAVNDAGKTEVDVAAFPSGGTWRISEGDGLYPVWSQKSHELLYQAGDQIMAVSYTTNGDTFINEKPRVWADKLGGVQAAQWDLMPDGKRLLVLSPVASPEAPKAEHEIVFLENFFDELRRKVPLTK